MVELLKRRYLFDLQLLADGEGDGTPGDDGAGTGDGDDIGTDAGDVGDQPGARNKEPFAVFPDKQSFMSRIKRESNKAVQELLAGLGLEGTDQLKEIVEAHKKQQEANKTELQKLQEKLQKAENERLQSINKANNILRMAEAKLVAGELGVKPDRIEKFLRLVNLEEVKVENGVVDRVALKELLEAELKDMPEFKVQPGVPRGGGEDFAGGGKGGAGSKPPADDILTMDKIKAMTKEEIEANIDKVREFLASQRK